MAVIIPQSITEIPVFGILEGNISYSLIKQLYDLYRWKGARMYLVKNDKNIFIDKNGHRSKFGPDLIPNSWIFTPDDTGEYKIPKELLDAYEETTPESIDYEKMTKFFDNEIEYSCCISPPRLIINIYFKHINAYIKNRQIELRIYDIFYNLNKEKCDKQFKKYVGSQEPAEQAQP